MPSRRITAGAAPPTRGRASGAPRACEPWGRPRPARSASIRGRLWARIGAISRPSRSSACLRGASRQLARHKSECAKPGVCDTTAAPGRRPFPPARNANLTHSLAQRRPRFFVLRSAPRPVLAPSWGLAQLLPFHREGPGPPTIGIQLTGGRATAGGP